MAKKIKSDEFFPLRLGFGMIVLAMSLSLLLCLILATINAILNYLNISYTSYDLSQQFGIVLLFSMGLSFIIGVVIYRKILKDDSL